MVPSSIQPERVFHHCSHQPYCTKKRTSSLSGSQTDSVISQNISFSHLRKMDQEVLHIGQYVFTISKVFKLRFHRKSDKNQIAQKYVL